MCVDMAPFMLDIDDLRADYAKVNFIKKLGVIRMYSYILGLVPSVGS